MSASQRTISNKNLHSLGLLLAIWGLVGILAQMFGHVIFMYQHTVGDVVPGTWEMTTEELYLWVLVPLIGIAATAGFFTSTRRYRAGRARQWGFFAGFTYILCTLAAVGALVLGGGWITGTILAGIGFSLELFTLARRDSGIEVEKTGDSFEGSTRGGLSGRLPLLLSGIIVAGLVGSFAIPFAVRVSTIPAPLIPAASTPPTDVSPTHETTFYILPIWEWQGSTYDDYAYGIQQLDYLKATVGGADYTGTGFVKIGRSVSCWYTNEIYENGSYNPTRLRHTLNLSTITGTPILFHMNGGNWGQCCSNLSVIRDMRENASNCQWDQKDICHPIHFNPGPNDRFWSFWPGSEWEQFRERNLKQALAVVYEWWQVNPDLLVGFSTDSEIHLNYHTFEDQNTGGYKSFFDYNPGTIQQYREWAAANWTLDEFNARCGTNYATWADVDAPRSSDVVDHPGNAWWETWTDFRIWHVKEAGTRQCRWITECGFPRDMIWHHQILSEPGDASARYQRCDPLETATNDYCRPGVTRYGWISPEIWASIGKLSLNDGSASTLPSWGIFEWNLWHQHEYWAYREMLACIYQYGGHVICPNEWTNCSINEGLWIPGDPCNKTGEKVINGTTYGSDDTGCGGTPGECCCTRRDDEGNCTRCIDPHGNPQFQTALRDFVTEAQKYPRGSAPGIRVSTLDLTWYDQHARVFNFFLDNDRGLYPMIGVWGLCVLYLLAIAIVVRKRPRSKNFGSVQ